MAKDTGDLLREALSLPPEARAALADSLLESLDTDIDEAPSRSGARKSADGSPIWTPAVFKP